MKEKTDNIFTYTANDFVCLNDLAIRITRNLNDTYDILFLPGFSFLCVELDEEAQEYVGNTIYCDFSLRQKVNKAINYNESLIEKLVLYLTAAEAILVMAIQNKERIFFKKNAAVTKFVSSCLDDLSKSADRTIKDFVTKPPIEEYDSEFD
jgi:hypothetical protein